MTGEALKLLKAALRGGFFCAPAGFLVDTRDHMRYQRLMGKAEKTLEKMRRNQLDWRLDDLKAIALALGIDWDQGGTSHCVFRHPGKNHVTVPSKRPIKPRYVRDFLALVDAVKGE